MNPSRNTIAESLARMSVQFNRILDSLAKQLTQVRLTSDAMSRATARSNADRYLKEVAYVERRKAVAHVHREAHRVRQELGLPTHKFVTPYYETASGWCAPADHVYQLPLIAPEDYKCDECGMIKGAHPA